MAPRRVKKRMQSAESFRPRLKTAGPRAPMEMVAGWQLLTSQLDCRNKVSDTLCSEPEETSIGDAVRNLNMSAVEPRCCAHRV